MIVLVAFRAFVGSIFVTLSVGLSSTVVADAYVFFTTVIYFASYTVNMFFWMIEFVALKGVTLKGITGTTMFFKSDTVGAITFFENTVGVCFFKFGVIVFIAGSTLISVIH